MDTILKRTLRGLVIGGLSLFIFLSFSSLIIDSPIFGENAAWAWDFNGALVSPTPNFSILSTTEATGIRFRSGRAMCIDASDNKYIVWFDSKDAGQGWNIYCEKLDANGNVVSGWDNRQITTSSSNEQYPSIAVDLNGKIHIVWEDNRNGGSQPWDIYYKRITSQGVVEVNDKRITSEAHNQRRPSIAVDANGNAHIIWEDSRNDTTGSNGDIYYAEVLGDAGGTTKFNDVKISNDSAVNVYSFKPSIAADLNNDVHIVWDDDRNGSGIGSTYYSKIYADNAGGTVLKKVDNMLVSDQTVLVSDESDASIAVEPTGNAVHIVWATIMGGNNNNWDVYYRKIGGNGVPVAPSRKVASGTNNQRFPSVAVDYSGNAHIAWAELAGGSDWNISYEVIAANLAPTPLVSARTLTNNTSAQETPFISVDSFNNAHVVWEDNRSGSKEVYYNSIDLLPPSAPVSLTVTQTPTKEPVVLSWSAASDSISGILNYEIRRNGTPIKLNCTPESYTDLTPGAGIHNYAVYARDKAGNLGAPATIQVTVDKTAPTGSVIINSGALYTNDNNVGLTLQATDDAGSPMSNVAKMHLNYSGTFDPWEDYASSRVRSLSTVQGTKTVTVEYMDYAGNISPKFTDTITLDSVNPTATGVKINKGAIYATSETVVMTWEGATDATSGLDKMYFGIPVGQWKVMYNYALNGVATLESANGLRTIEAMLQDKATNYSVTYTDSIYLDTGMPTGTIVINGGNAYTSSESVTLTLTATDEIKDNYCSGVSAESFSTNEGSSWTAWENLTPTKSLPVPTGDGSKNVYARYRDRAGNVSTATIVDSIILDKTVPTITGLTIEGTDIVNAYTNTTTVTVDIYAVDGAGAGVASMRFNSNGTLTGWETIAPKKSGLTLISGNGTRTVTAEVLDAIGNKSVIRTDIITLDAVAPTSEINTGGAYGATTWNNITGTTQDPVPAGSPPISGLHFLNIKIQRSGDGWFWNDSALPSATWEVNEHWNNVATFTLPGQTGIAPWTYLLLKGNLTSGRTYTVTTRAIDWSGNVQFPDRTKNFTYVSDLPTVHAWLGSAISVPGYGLTTWKQGTAYADATIRGDAAAGEGGSISTLEVQIKREDGRTWKHTTQIFTTEAIWINITSNLVGSTWYYNGLPSLKLDNNTSYTVAVRARDNVPGNPNMSATHEATFTFDNLSPKAILKSPTGYVSGTISITGEASDPGPGGGVDNWKILYQKSGGVTTELPGGTGNGAVYGEFKSFDSRMLPGGDGTYTFYLKVEDWAGNATAEGTTSALIDNTAPTIEIIGTSGQQKGVPNWYTGPVTVTLEASDAPAGLDKIHWAIDVYGSLGTGETSSSRATVKINGLGTPLTYTLKYWATDRSGNKSEDKYIAFNIDDGNPPPPMILDPADNFRTPLDHYTISGQADSDVAKVLIYKLGSTSPTVEVTPNNDPWKTWELPNVALDKGANTFIFTAKDIAGNVSTLFNGVTIHSDRTGPNVTITPYTRPINAAAATTAILSGTTESDATTVLVRVNKVGGWNPATITAGTNIWNKQLTGLVAGTNSIEVQAFDDFNNAGNISSTSIVVDVLAPEMPNVSTLPAAINPMGAPITVTGECDYAAGNLLKTEKVTVKMWYAGQVINTQTITVSGKIWSVSENLDNEGIYTFEAYATDYAGNDSAHDASVSTVRDTQVPTGAIEIVSTTSNGFVRSRDVTLNLSKLAGGSNVSMNIRNAGGTGAWENFASPKDWALIDGNGLRTVEVQYRDQAMNLSPVYKYEIMLDQIKPTVSEVTLNNFSITNPLPNPGVDPKVIDSKPKITVTASDENGIANDGIVVEFINGGSIRRFEFDGTNNTPSSLQISDVDGPLAAGKYTLRITVLDAAGNDSVLTFDKVVVSGGDPTITSKVIAAPNPFNPLNTDGKKMKIWFTVAGDANSVIGVYLHDIAGRLVYKRTYTAQELFGKNYVEWDGYTDFGQVGQNGVFLLRVTDETNKKLIGKTKVVIIKQVK